MSDRRCHSFHRAANQAFQGRHVREAIRRLEEQARRPWPKATAPTTTPTTIPAPAPTSGAGTTTQKEPT